jgi:NADPH:quinone reductase-like Zn-dependent oxidoreductase
MFRAVCYVSLALITSATPLTMKAVVVTGEAPAADFSKVQIAADVPVPTPGVGQVLIRIVASSINPIDWKIMEMPMWGKGRVAGFDVAGIVESVGLGCTRLQIGDSVWADLGKGLGGAAGVQIGAWAEYALADESQVGLKATTMSFEDAGSLPLVALTTYQAYIQTRAPWKGPNVTVVVTSGSGGTGVVGIQLAKAFGASRIITASSPRNFDLLKSLGATDVIDYHKSSIWETLQEESVDVVYDNYGSVGTADAAMQSLKSNGGFFVFLPGKGGALSDKPKKGVTQIDFGLLNPSKHEELDALAALADENKLRAVVPKSYMLPDIIEALKSSVAGHSVGKIGINITHSATSKSIVV